MSSADIAKLEQEIVEQVARLNELRRANPPEEVPNYQFSTEAGEISLLDMFGQNDKLLVIHNMGQGCRYCTLWADGFNGLVAHLESAMSVYLVSKDTPDLQRKFANSRGWKFKLASHGGDVYAEEQTTLDGYNNMPGAAVYERQDEKIMRKNTCVFGPGDLYCAQWSLLGLAGLGEPEWTPQFNYWLRPDTLEDGGANLLG